MLTAIAELVLQGMFEVAAYWTGRVLLPCLSFGRARGEPWAGPPWSFPWYGVRRSPNGTIVFQAEATALVGLVFWVLCIVAAVPIWI
jgi:hypothetical protein